MQIESPSIADIAAGMRTAVEFTVDGAQMDTFAQLSGDRNPLHCDDAFAQAKGFKGRVVYGALLVAKVSQLIGMRLPGRDSVWSSLNLQFHQPLYIGEAARVEAEVTSVSASTGFVTLALAVHAGERKLAKGKAEVLLVG